MIRFLRKCCHCKCHTLNKTVLCLNCWENLHREIASMNGVFEADELNVLSLFQHIEGLNRDLIINLKGGGIDHTFEELARILVKFAQFQGLIPANLTTSLKRTIVIPMPSQRFQGAANHSYCLANQVGKIMGVEVKEIIQIAQDVDDKIKKHKEKNKKERGKRAMILSEKISVQVSNIIFIDDVITTGATLRAARAVVLESFKLENEPSMFNRPPQFHFWTLSRTPKQL